MGKEYYVLQANNKKAYHDYFIEDTYECGMVLVGTEVKSIRCGKISIKEAYVKVKNGEAWLVGSNVQPYEQGNRFNGDPLRDRKLLLHKKEIQKLENAIKLDGMTLVPLKVYIKGSLIKVEIGIARGKKNYDKRQSLKEKDSKRSIERKLKGQ